MAFTLPQFNLTAKVWHSPAEPPAAHSTTMSCQLYVNSRLQGQLSGPSEAFIRVPWGSDLRPDDIVDPDGNGVYYYQVIGVDPLHLGFSNQYLAGSAIMWIVPSPPGSNRILLEDGFVILLEDGFAMLLE